MHKIEQYNNRDMNKRKENLPEIAPQARQNFLQSQTRPSPSTYILSVRSDKKA